MTALRCMKCRRTIRKGQDCVVICFARAGESEDGRVATEPWLSVVTCFRQGCMASLTPEVIREARQAELRAVTGPGSGEAPTIDEEERTRA